MDLHRLAEARSLAYHAVVAQRLDTAVLVRASAQLSRFRAKRLVGERYLLEWEALLSGPKEALLERVRADDEAARALRQTTPLAGVVSPTKRRDIWRAVRADFAAA